MLRDRRLLPRLPSAALGLTLILGACSNKKVEPTSTTPVQSTDTAGLGSHSAPVAPAVVAQSDVEQMSLEIGEISTEMKTRLAELSIQGSMSDESRKAMLELELAKHGRLVQIAMQLEDAKDLTSEKIEELKARLKIEMEQSKETVKILLAAGKSMSAEALKASMDRAAVAYDASLAFAEFSVEVARAYPAALKEVSIMRGRQIKSTAQAVGDQTVEGAKFAAEVHGHAVEITAENMVKLQVWSKQKAEFAAYVVDAIGDGATALPEDIVSWNAERLLEANTAIVNSFRYVEAGVIDYKKDLVGGAQIVKEDLLARREKLIDAELNFALHLSNTVLNATSKAELNVKLSVIDAKKYLAEQAEYTGLVIDAFPAAFSADFRARYEVLNDKASKAYQGAKKAYVATSKAVGETLEYNKNVALAMPGAVGETIASGYNRSLDGTSSVIRFLRSHNPFRRD